MDLSQVSAQTKRGQIFIVDHFNGDEILCDRLHELGLRPGLALEYWGRAPLAGPFLFRFQNTMLALRPLEASCIKVRD